MNLDNRVTTSGSSINQSSVPQKNGPSIGTLSKYDETVPLKQISINQIIRGEVTDLRNNQVTVMLTDNTTVTGKLNNGSMLSIGDTAAFKISSIYPCIELEPFLQNEIILENSTIQKALDLAGLPKTEKNQQIVHELMNNHMPINKQSIQNMLHQSYQFKNAQISTLVLMNRHNIPVTKENVSQFEAYRNMEHQLVSKVESFSESIPSLLQLLSKKSPALAVSAFGNQLLGILLSGDPPLKMEGNPTISYLSLEERELLQQILKEVPLSEMQLEDIQNGTASIRDVVHLLNDENDSYDVPIVKNLLSTFSEIQYQNNELGSILNDDTRLQLIKQLEGFSISNNLKDGMLSGELSIYDTLKTIHTSISSTSEKSVIHLFESEVFKTLFKSHIASTWTIKPKDLNKEGSIDTLYEKMYEQSKELDTFFKATLGNTDIGSSLSKQANDIKQNMDFMQTLNQMFSYIQIPLKLNEKNVHSELYVYTKKHSLKENPDNISVLLHLDMEHLGALDIYVAIKQNQVTTKFYLPDKTTKNIFKDNINLLDEALQEKGYSITTEFLMRERNVDIVKDFIEMDNPINSVKRYTFDIRA